MPYECRLGPLLFPQWSSSRCYAILCRADQPWPEIMTIRTRPRGQRVDAALRHGISTWAVLRDGLLNLPAGCFDHWRLLEEEGPWILCGRSCFWLSSEPSWDCCMIMLGRPKS